MVIEGPTEVFDVTPTGMTQITYIPQCIQFKALGRFPPSINQELKFKLDASFTLMIIITNTYGTTGQEYENYYSFNV